MPLSAGARLGPYEVLAPLGAGGMGEVYRARDTRLGREVALKVLPEELSLDRDRLARFEQEARSASALNHPNIVTVHDIGQLDAMPYIAMELVEGKTLRELSASEPLPIRKLLNIAPQIADGLAKAHAAGIVHRDLKPENVMVSKDGFVKILDFGLAKLVAPESGEISAMPTLAKPETHPGTVMGTVSYMSPEQASGQPLDYRSDQFSLGSILYEAATGQKAFQKKTAAETMSAIIREEPKPIGQVEPRVPLPLKWIVERCLAKDPEERYASTRDLARDLAGARDHISEATSGAEALLAGPIRRRGRLLPLWAGAGILAIGLLAGWAAQSLWKEPASSAPSFRRLTFRQGGIGNARFAPDGQTIVYGAFWEGEHVQMYLTRPESPESRPFDFGDADILSISPSGELAIVLDLVTKPTLARVPLAGGVPRQVLEGVGYANADWAPDGKLAVVRSVEGKDRLEFPIGKVLFEGSISSPRVSPRGDRIAFFEQAGSGSVAVIDTSGKGKRTLSSGWSGLAGVPCWTPDGEEIWFTAGEVGKPAALYAVNQSGKRRLVMRVPGSLELDDISADGRVLVANHSIQRSLMGLAPGESKERDLTWLDASVPSDLSPDGKTLVITERGEGSGPTPAVYLRKTDGTPAVRLGEGLGLALSPDQKWVLTLVEPASSAPHLALLPTGAGESRTLKNDRFERFGEADSDWLGGSDWGADWSPDGKRIVFTAAERGHRRRIYVQDLAGGLPRPVSPEGVGIRRFTSALSPDGRFFVGVQGPGSAAIYPVDGGEARAIKGLARDRPVQWSADGRSLFVYGGTEFPRKIWLLDPSTGARQPWKEFRSLELADRGFQPLITPDGKSYVYGSARALSELYLVEGLK